MTEALEETVRRVGFRPALPENTTPISGIRRIVSQGLLRGGKLHPQELQKILDCCDEMEAERIPAPVAEVNQRVIAATIASGAGI